MSPGASERSKDEAIAPALVLEVRVAEEWREFSRLGPSALPGSLSHNGPEGRQVYMFRCLGDYSILQRSEAGVDVGRGDLRGVSSLGLEDVARLTMEEPTVDFWLRPDNASEPVRFRFRHQP
jgi:hypothetical protein